MSMAKVFIPERGVIADFNLNPTLGSETGKIRPCIVVSNNIYNQKLSVIQVVPITEWSEKKARIITRACHHLEDRGAFEADFCEIQGEKCSPVAELRR